MHAPLIFAHHAIKGAVLSHVAHQTGASGAAHATVHHAALTGAGFAGKAAATKVAAHGAVAHKLATAGVTKHAVASSAHVCSTPAVHTVAGSVGSAAVPAATA